MNRLLAPRTQVGLLVVALVVAVGVLGTVGWVAWSARAAAQVSTDWRLDCPGTIHVGRHQGQPTVWSRPGWRCQVRMRVVNDGDREVRVTGVTARMVGAESRHEVRALGTGSAMLRETGSGTDARWDVDLLVPAQATRTVTLAVGWRQEGCNGSGYVTIRPWTTLRFEAVGRAHEVTSAQPLVLRTFDDAHDGRACPD